MAGIASALAGARAAGLSVIPHGAGHSYTDAALNTGGLVIDDRPMRRILAWDAAQGIMRAEPGVTLRQLVQMAAPDGWWPAVSPSTPEATLGGCAAMNVNGRNAWKRDVFGATLLAMDVLLATGEPCTLSRERDSRLLHAFAGSMGLLGIITSLTIQLQRVPSGFVSVRSRSAGSVGQILDLFAEEAPRSDFMEAWLDGFAGGPQLGRGILTSATLEEFGEAAPSQFPEPGPREIALVRLAARLGRPVVVPGMRMANRANFWRASLNRNAAEQRSLFAYTYWSAAAFGGYPWLRI